MNNSNFYPADENILDTLERLRNKHHGSSWRGTLEKMKTLCHWRAAKREVARRELAEKNTYRNKLFAYDLARHIERSAGWDSGMQTKFMLEDTIEKFEAAKEGLASLKESKQEGSIWSMLAETVGGEHVLNEILETNFAIIPGLFSDIDDANGAGIRYMHIMEGNTDGVSHDSASHSKDANLSPALDGVAPANPLAKFKPTVKNWQKFVRNWDRSSKNVSARDIESLFTFGTKLQEALDADELVTAQNLNTLKQARALVQASESINMGKRSLLNALGIIGTSAAMAYLGVNATVVGVFGVAAAFLTGTAAQSMSALSQGVQAGWYQFSFSAFPRKYGPLAERITESMFTATMGSQLFMYGFTKFLGVGSAQKKLLHETIRALTSYDSADLLRTGQQDSMMKSAQTGEGFFRSNMPLTQVFGQAFPNNQLRP